MERGLVSDGTLHAYEAIRMPATAFVPLAEVQYGKVRKTRRGPYGLLRVDMPPVPFTRDYRTVEQVRAASRPGVLPVDREDDFKALYWLFVHPGAATGNEVEARYVLTDSFWGRRKVRYSLWLYPPGGIDKRFEALMDENDEFLVGYQYRARADAVLVHDDGRFDLPFDPIATTEE